MYYKHRPTIGIKEQDLLKIDAQFGWHKSMRGMKHLYDDGKVAIVQGVGYDQPSFSHFTSMSFWHTAAPNSGNEYGWIGRTASALDPAGARAEHDREHLRQPDAGGEGARSTCRWCSSIRRGSSAACSRRRRRRSTRWARSTTPVGDAHQYVLEVTRSAAQASEVVRAAWSKYTGKDNPDLRLLDLDKVAALIEADFPTKLYYVPLRNSLFDTHVNQAAPHDRQLRILLGRHRRLLPGDEAHRPRRRRRDVHPQRVRPARAGEHQPRHRPRHGAGELRDRQRA